MVTYISTPQDLDNIRNNLSESFELMNDIDMSGFGYFIPINNFKGNFDGKGFKIKNLNINVSSAYAGLFTYINNPSTTIKNLGIENCNINSNNYNWTGAIVGTLMNGIIENCYSTGIIKGQYMVGGIVGNFQSGSVKNCWSNADISGVARIGALVGYIFSSNAKVENCYAYGTATQTNGGSFIAGGLIGDNEDTTFNNVINSYWDTERSGLNSSEGGLGKNTTEMKTQSTYNGWDFTDTWGINGDYPYLKIFGIPSLPAQTVTIDINSHLNAISNSLDVSKRVLRVSLSSLQTIESKTFKTVVKQVKSHVEGILSSIDVSNANIKTYNVNSYINEIDSSIHVSKDGTKTITTYLEPINSFVEVIIPIRDKEVYANVYVVENRSEIISQLNQSHSFIIENPTRLKVK